MSAEPRSPATVEKRTNTGVLSRRLEGRGARELGERLVALEVAVGRRAARVHDALGDALVVEVGDLLAQDEVLEQRGPAQPGLQRVLVVGDGTPWLVVSGWPVASTRSLVERADGQVLAGGRGPPRLAGRIRLGQ